MRASCSPGTVLVLRIRPDKAETYFEEAHVDRAAFRIVEIHLV
jgi:hypothetical protein